MATEHREPRWWVVEGRDLERMTSTTIDEAVQDWGDNLAPEILPSEVVVIGFAPMQPKPDDCGDILEAILESLDEEFGDPDGDGVSEPTPGMVEAERAFRAAIVAEYDSWACEEVTRETVSVREHVPADWPVAVTP